MRQVDLIPTCKPRLIPHSTILTLAAVLLTTACSEDPATATPGPDMASPDLATSDLGRPDAAPDLATSPDMTPVQPQGELRVEGDGERLIGPYVGERVSLTMTLVNDTPRPVLLSGVTLQERQEDDLDELWLDADTPKTLAPGARAQVQITYRPLNAVEDSASVTFLVTDEGKMRLVSAFVFARFMPGPELVYPDMIRVGERGQGPPVRRLVAIYNNTERPQRLRDLYLAPMPTAFSVAVASAQDPEDASADAPFSDEVELPSKQATWLAVRYDGPDAAPAQAQVVFVSTLGTRQIRVAAP